MKTSQVASNPFVNSDSNKRYYTYDCYLRRTFGAKLAKIPLDAGLSCPNVERGGGCIYCSPSGSGDCIAHAPSLAEQYRIGRERLSSKWDTTLTIAYLQAHTNTYAPVERLKAIYSEVLSFEGVVALNVATRADCVGEDVCALLDDVSKKTHLTVELGLQSSSDVTARAIGRGHDFAEFVSGFARLRRLVPRAEICVHVIFGLPGETREDMMRTARDLARLHPDQVKIHLLHVLRSTPLEDMYRRGAYVPMEREDYIETVASALATLPPDVVIARLTGDGVAEDLVAPEWSRKKIAVINDVDKYLFSHDLWQGKYRA